MSEAKVYYCPGCGTSVVNKTAWRVYPACPKCGLMLREGEPPKQGKRGLLAILVTLAVLMGIVVYFALR